MWIFKLFLIAQFQQSIDRIIYSLIWLDLELQRQLNRSLLHTSQKKKSIALFFIKFNDIMEFAEFPPYFANVSETRK